MPLNGPCLLGHLRAQVTEHRLQLEQKRGHRVGRAPATAHLRLPLRVHVVEVAEHVQADHLLALQPSVSLHIGGAAPVLELEGEANLGRASWVVTWKVDEEVQGDGDAADVGHLHLGTHDTVPQRQVI